MKNLIKIENDTDFDLLGEVIAVNDRGDVLVGYLYFDYGLSVVSCEDEHQQLIGATHYLQVKDFIEQSK